MPHVLFLISLQHSDEYIRSDTLHFLQKIFKDAGFFEPVIPTCRSYLTHRHSYVLMNDVFIVYTIYREYEYLSS
ncbi:uncharacterized protein EDB91DRAFT_1130141 [Suillus paluster]|uniref:uncharacterized protein n=1 Tax=Suillus paluster TaxID=48578 RepID=UPI001B8719E7|nr:uncharacterized protein EDB91DRAFT_1130141 [Suillus paluster]KAG1741910.1 hypothetical protein EDB91DRAFT_1130141 [Suillus paluster]